MRNTIISYAFVFAFIAVYIKDLGWLHSNPDGYSALLALPLFYYMFKKYIRGIPNYDLSNRIFTLSLMAFGLGFLADSTLLCSLAWSTAFIYSLKTYTTLPFSHLQKTIPMVSLLFPWCLTDLTTLGWYFRLSAAYIVSTCAKGLDYNVINSGTSLLVNSQSIFITPECSGIKTLQFIFLIGSIGLWYLYKHHSLFYLSLLLLLPLAWLVNTTRVVSIVSVSLSTENEMIRNLVHSCSGPLLILLLVFMPLRYLFQCQSK